MAFPTETVYGLGADVFNEKAVCRIFEAKKRPSFDPLIVHVASIAEAEKLFEHVPDAARRLMNEFWPGPLTLVMPKSSIVPDVVTSGLPTVAVRMPKNDIALALIKSLGHPIAAPSANIFGYTSPTSASHVMEDLGDRVDMILDGGETLVGVESTVLKVDADHCEILRPGAVTQEQIEKFMPVKLARSIAAKVEAPGQLQSHYAPWTPLYLLEKPWTVSRVQVQHYLEDAQKKNGSLPRIGLLAFQNLSEGASVESVQILSPSGDLAEAASNLFQAIRKLDKMHLDLLFAEPVPEKGIGIAIMDRLKKASGGNYAEKLYTF